MHHIVQVCCCNLYTTMHCMAKMSISSSTACSFFTVFYIHVMPSDTVEARRHTARHTHGNFWSKTTSHQSLYAGVYPTAGTPSTVIRTQLSGIPASFLGLLNNQHLIGIRVYVTEEKPCVKHEKVVYASSAHQIELTEAQRCALTSSLCHLQNDGVICASQPAVTQTLFIPFFLKLATYCQHTVQHGQVCSDNCCQGLHCVVSRDRAGYIPGNPYVQLIHIALGGCSGGGLSGQTVAIH